MNFIEKLFNQYPFIYFVDGKYYAFGDGVCSLCDCKSVLLESRYRNFEASINMDLTVEEAWRIFHKLVSEAEFVKNEKGFCVHTKKEFLNMSFSDKQLLEIETQVDRYITYWKKYKFSQYLH